MTLPLESVETHEFQSIFLNPNTDSQDIVRLCMNTAERFFHNKDIRSLRGAALCFSAQQFHSLGITRDDQKYFSEEVYDSLRKI